MRWYSLRLLTIVTAAVFVAVGVLTARAALDAEAATHPSPGFGIEIQAVYDHDGNPALVANFAPNGGLAVPHWEICPPGTARCRTVHGASRSLDPGSTRAGTVFAATAVYRGRRYSAHTARWLGQVRAVRAPGLDGQPKAGITVRPVAALWRGGWEAETSYRARPGLWSAGRAPASDALSVEACLTRSGTGCMNLTPQEGADGFTRRSVRIPMRFTGWYLFAFDQRFAADTAFAGVAYSSPEAIPPLKVGATVARSLPYGPVRR